MMKKSEFTDKPIFLTGFMASGKTTLGKAIALKLDKPFQDLDDMITKHESRTVNEIFGQNGEEYFRNIERELLLEISSSFNGVMALGGGALQNQQIVTHLKNNGLLIYIETPIEEIAERVINSRERPILFNKDGKIKSKQTLFAELKALYLHRQKFYNQAHIRISTSVYNSTEHLAESVVEKILRYV